jgi:hypothetical protein
MNKRFALLLLCAAFALAAYLLLDEWRFEKLASVAKLQQLWEQDMQMLEENHQLPRTWSSIREIELTPGSPEALDWLKRLTVPVVISKSGDFKLQILFLPWTEGETQGVFLQYDLMDLKSPNNNTVFETNRTIILNGETNWLEQMLKPLMSKPESKRPEAPAPPKKKS